MANGAQSVGGQSRPGGRAVLVTPSGEVVGTAAVQRRGGSGRGGVGEPKDTSEAQRRAEEFAREEALRQKAIEEGIKVLEQKLKTGRISDRQRQFIEIKILELKESSARQTLPMTERMSVDTRQTTTTTKPSSEETFRRIQEASGVQEKRPSTVMSVIRQIRPQRQVSTIREAERQLRSDPIFFSKEFVKSPITTIQIVGKEAGRLAEQATPEGMTITRKEIKTTIPVEQRGTFDPTIPKTKEVVRPSKTIFIDPKRVGQGVSIGTQLGLFATAPSLVVGPALTVSGVETAIDPTLTKGQRVLGIVEAEVGLLTTGLGVKRLVKDLPPVKVPDIIPDPQISGPQTFFMGATKKKSKTKQVVRKKAQKKKAVTKSDVEDFLRVDTKIKGKQTTVTILGRSQGSFTSKAEKARFLLKNAKTTEARREALSLIREVYGDDFLRDFLSQEYGLIPKVKQKVQQVQKQTQQVKQVQQVRQQQGPRDFQAIAQQPRQQSGMLVAPSQQVRQQQGQRQQQVLRSGVLQFSLQESETIQRQRQESDFKPRLRFDFGFDTQTSTDQTFGGGTGTTFTPRTPKPRTPTGDFKITPPRTSSTSQILGGGVMASQTKGYIPQVKDKGRWIDVVKKALSKKDALALAGKVVDNTTSQQLRLKETRRKVTKLKSRPKTNLNKFRDFKVTSGKKQKLQNFGLIEKAGARIDTVGEKRQLSAARYMKSKQFAKASATSKRRVRRGGFSIL